MQSRNLAALMLGAALMEKATGLGGGKGGTNRVNPADLDVREKGVIPKGCELFEFRHATTGRDFSTVAMNFKSAKAKYLRWLKKEGLQ
jgi:hypothetical protein